MVKSVLVLVTDVTNLGSCNTLETVSPARLPAAVMRARILDLQQACFDGIAGGSKVPAAIEEFHHFADGWYARQIFIPAGTTLIGKIHRTKHMNIVHSGLITVATEDGLVTIDAQDGPYVFWAEPGTKRAGYAHEDTVWTTLHETDETDLEKLELELIAPSFAALEGPKEFACLG